MPELVDFPLNEQDYRGGKLLENLLLFGQLCKQLGMTVTPHSMIEVARALEFIDLGHKADFYYSLRTLIVTRQRDLALFDQAFRAFWRPPPEGQSRPQSATAAGMGIAAQAAVLAAAGRDG